MLCRDPDGYRVESETEHDVHPLRRARPQGWRWNAPRARDWAVALPSFLTICVLAYAGQQSMGVSASHGPPSAAVPPAPAAPAPRADPALRPAYAPIPMAKAEPKPLGEPVKHLAEVIALSEAVVEARTELNSAPHAFQTTASLRSSKNLTLGEHALEVQRRLAELGYLSTRPTGVWGTLSRRALRSFKEANGLPADDVWDESAERALFASAAQAALPFVGTWASDAKGCSGPRQTSLLHTVIDSSGAKAGNASCAFNNRRQVGDAWNVDASCRDGRERWTANVQLTVNKGRLTWTSERGTQSYIRCG
jgi:hypothetical protein